MQSKLLAILICCRAGMLFKDLMLLKNLSHNAIQYRSTPSLPVRWKNKCISIFEELWILTVGHVRYPLLLTTEGLHTSDEFHIHGRSALVSSYHLPFSTDCHSYTLTWSSATLRVKHQEDTLVNAGSPAYYFLARYTDRSTVHEQRCSTRMQSHTIELCCWDRHI